MSDIPTLLSKSKKKIKTFKKYIHIFKALILRVSDNVDKKSEL